VYGLPPDIDVSFLVDVTLTQVPVGEYQVQLHFTESGPVTPAYRPPWISVESTASVTAQDGSTTIFDTSPELGRSLVDLLGRTVTAATGKRDGTLTLLWDDGTQVEILDSSDQYESYQFGHEDVYFVV
jgi:hypothetical protein